MSRVLVTGGAGFIGSHLAGRLAREGHAVRVLDDLSTGSRANLARSGVELVEGDLRDRDTARRALAGVEAVFHLAAMPSVTRSWTDPLGSVSVNGIGSAVLVEEAERAGAARFVYSSSSSIYGDQPAERKSEDLEPRPVSPYGQGKLLGEKLVLGRDAPGGLRTIALRYFNVFGPRQDPASQYSAVIPSFICRGRRGQEAVIYGDGLQSRDFTFVENVVEANLLALASPAGGVAVNVGCGEAHTLNDLVRLVSEIQGRPLRVRHEPPRQGDIRHSLADIGRARELLGYRPLVGFEEGLRRTDTAYRETCAEA